MLSLTYGQLLNTIFINIIWAIWPLICIEDFEIGSSVLTQNACLISEFIYEGVFINISFSLRLILLLVKGNIS